jgi:hypothetical protein
VKLIVWAFALAFGAAGCASWWPWQEPPGWAVPTPSPTVEPTPLPTPTPAPVFPPPPSPPVIEPPTVQLPEGAGYPRKVQLVRAKIHVPGSDRPDGNAIVDAVALACGDNPDFPTRTCWPACGPEHSPLREMCDRALPMFWVGGLPHPSNPWLHRAAPGESVRVCVEGEATQSGDDICSTLIVGR